MGEEALTMQTCSIDGCTNKASRPNGWCHTHYDRYIRTGDPHVGTKNDAWPKIKAALPGETSVIAEKTGLSRRCVCDWMRKMRDATPREVYIKRWLRPDGRGRFTAVYALGDKPDAPCTLERKSRAETDADYRKRLIANGEIYHLRAKQLARYYETRAKRKKNTWLGALGVA